MNAPISEMKPPGGRFESIDCLRGWALIGVFVIHCALVVPAVGAGFMTLFRTGQFGVDLFFVISGFVLCESAFRRQRQAGWRAQAGFFRRRLYRLIPLYWIGMLLYRYLIEGSLGLRGEEAPLQVWAGNLMLLNGWQPGWENYILPGGWSIGAEATFAAVFALIYPWVKSLKIAVFWWVGMIVLVAFFTTPLSRMVTSFIPRGGDPSSGYFSFRNLPSFFGGIVVWHMHRSGVSGSISTRISLLVMTLVVGAFDWPEFWAGRELGTQSDGGKRDDDTRADGPKCGSSIAWRRRDCVDWSPQLRLVYRALCHDHSSGNYSGYTAAGGSIGVVNVWVSACFNLRFYFSSGLVPRKSAGVTALLSKGVPIFVW